MTVPSGYPNDSFLIGATSGERVNVDPTGGRDGGDTVIHNLVTLDGRVVFENFVREARARGMGLSPIL